MPAETHEHGSPPDAAQLVELLGSLLGSDVDPDTTLADVGVDDTLVVIDLWGAVVEEFGERALGDLDIELDEIPSGTVGELASMFVAALDPDAEDGWEWGPLVEEVAEGTPLAVEVGGHRFVVVRVGDDFYVLGERCTHTGDSLAEVGEVDGSEIECAAHGARFDLATGAATSLPATRPLPTAEARVVAGRLQLRWQDAERSAA